VAVATGGDIATTTGGPWTTTAVAGVGFGGVSCAPSSFCAAVDDAGNVYTTSEPTAGSGAWTPISVDAIESLNDISCAPSGFCAIADSGGNVLTSTNPAAGPSTWTGGHIGFDLSHLSCPAATLCVGLEDFGEVATSTDPGGGAGAWTVADIDGSESLTGVSCPSLSLCVAVDGTGDILTSTDPDGGAAAWKSTWVGNQSFTGVSCASSTLCVAIDHTGEVVTSTDPTGGPAQWTRFDIDGTIPLASISCNPSLCVVVDGGRGIVTSTDPTGGTLAWTVSVPSTSATYTNGYEISCPSASFCSFVPGGPDVADSTDPTGDSSNWSFDYLAPSSAAVYLGTVTGVSCVSAALCVAVDDEGNAAVGQPAPSPASDAPTPATGSAPPSTKAPAPVTPAAASRTAIRGTLLAALTPRGAGARIAALLAHRGYEVGARGLTAGSERIDWYAAAGAHRVLIASGRVSFTAAGVRKLELRLTSAGRIDLRKARRLALSAQGSFAIRTGGAVTATARFVARRTG
jgi:hypothetical protein